MMAIATRQFWRQSLDHLLATGVVPALAHFPQRIRDPAAVLVAGGMSRAQIPSAGREAAIEMALGCHRAAARSISRRLRANILRAMVDYRRWLLSPERRSAAVVWEDQHNLYDAFVHGRGVVLASAHTVALYAGWWQALAGFERRGFEIAALIGEGNLRPVPGNWRTPNPRSSSAPRLALKDLESNRLVLVVADNYRDPARRTVDRSFLGAQCSFPVGAATLARLAQAPIVPAVALRRGAGYAIRFYTPLAPPQRDDRAADLMLTDALLDLFERIVRAHPDQYEFYPPADRQPSAAMPAGDATGRQPGFRSEPGPRYR